MTDDTRPSSGLSGRIRRRRVPTFYERALSASQGSARAPVAHTTWSNSCCAFSTRLTTSPMPSMRLAMRSASLRVASWPPAARRSG